MQPTDDCIELEGWYCQLEVGDAFAVPSKLCEDTGSLPTDVTCRDAWSYLDIEEEPEPEPEPDLPENEEPTIGRTIVLGCSDFIDWTSSRFDCDYQSEPSSSDEDE